MPILAQFAPRFAAANAQFVPAWLDVPAGTPFGLIHDLDAGNINPTTAVLADGETLQPTALLVPRGSHVHWFFGLTGVNGKRPIVTVDNTTRQNASTMAGSWVPVFSYDQITWQPFDSGYTALSSPVRVRFQHSTAFTQGTVYIADHPVFRSIDWATNAALLQAQLGSVVHVSALADVNGVIGTTPAEVDGLGRQVGGNPMWGFRLEDTSLPTTDGGPRREVLITGGMHAGEIVDGWFHRGMIDWYLNGTGPVHARFRRNFRILTYFSVTPNGRKGGDWRTNVQRSLDPNRDWVGFTLYETQRIRDAVIADQSRVDAHIDLHSASPLNDTALIYTLISSAQDTADYAAFKTAFDAVDPSALNLVSAPLDAATLQTTASGWGRREFGAFAIISEPGTRVTATAARYAEVGVNYLQALTQMDVQGAWWNDATTLAASLTASATVTANLSAPGGASAVLSAGLMASGTVAASLSGGTATYSGLLCPALTLASRYAPRVTLRSRCT